MNNTRPFSKPISVINKLNGLVDQVIIKNFEPEEIEKCADFQLEVYSSTYALYFCLDHLLKKDWDHFRQTKINHFTYLQQLQRSLVAVHAETKEIVGFIGGDYFSFCEISENTNLDGLDLYYNITGLVFRKADETISRFFKEPQKEAETVNWTVRGNLLSTDLQEQLFAAWYFDYNKSLQRVILFCMSDLELKNCMSTTITTYPLILGVYEYKSIVDSEGKQIFSSIEEKAKKVGLDPDLYLKYYLTMVYKQNPFLLK